MFTIYSDLNSQIKVENGTLFENETYYLVFDYPEHENLKSYFSNKSSKTHISWHVGNKVAEVNIKNYIGKFRILDKEFDVRSKKFNEKLTGIEQVELIIIELNELLKRISFSYDSSIYNNVKTDWDEIQDNNIHKLNFLYQLFFEVENHKKAGYQLEKIKRNASTKHEASYKEKHIWAIKKVTPSVTKELARTGFRLGDRNKAQYNKRINFQEQSLTNNTSENQFVRFFYEYCMAICLKILVNKIDLPESVVMKSVSVLNECKQLLADPFFTNVSLPTIINTRSTILASREGYNNLFIYYINSLFSVKHIFEEYKNTLKVDLIDIATLYEIWCFYKLAYEILGNHILVTEMTSQIKNGKIKYSATFENDDYKVSYNKTFSISNHGSYSTSLRPDISVCDRTTNNLYHFDAKYRINSYLQSDSVEFKTFKNDDINKMHAYLDAIFHSKSAIILYPGYQFAFFEKRNKPFVVNDVSSDYSLNGVGALPLIPGTSNETLKIFAQRFLTSNHT